MTSVLLINKDYITPNKLPFYIYTILPDNRIKSLVLTGMLGRTGLFPKSLEMD